MARPIISQLELLNKRSRRAKPFMLSTHSTNDQLQTYIASLIHLFINRLFNQNQRGYEVLVYHHLARFYKSQLVQIQ
ncbi:lantibiotic dehydratase C-terminal domain-containing protein [Spirosoma telluris]|uniref:lantibiotic dehydratase C-terminal domain-containing protein n=1 Tax=Spirosoma telluris TaxID=2183553 RepID=UPI0038CD6A01